MSGKERIYLDKIRRKRTKNYVKTDSEPVDMGEKLLHRPVPDTELRNDLSKSCPKGRETTKKGAALARERKTERLKGRSTSLSESGVMKGRTSETELT